MKHLRFKLALLAVVSLVLSLIILFTQPFNVTVVNDKAFFFTLVLFFAFVAGYGRVDREIKGSIPQAK